MGESGIRLVRLSREYDLASFDCGDHDLNEFLSGDALAYQREFLANTTLLIIEERVVAYFSLAADAIQLTHGERDDEGIETPFLSFPALKIARLATDSGFRGRGYGTTALEFCVGLARHLNDEHRHDGIGCRFITVDAYEESEAWYAERGFVKNERVNNKNRETTSLRLGALPYED